MIKRLLEVFLIVLAGFQTVTGAQNDTINLGKIRVISSEQALLIPAKPALDSGILEYIAVTTGGKTYESVLALDCDPKNFHAALLLINAKPGKIGYVDNPETSLVVIGDTLDLTIVYSDREKTVSLDVKDLITYRDSASSEAQKGLKKEMRWVFTGSTALKVDNQGTRVHGSAMEGSLVSIVPDPNAEINCTKLIDNPYRTSGGFCVNTAMVKRLGSECYLKIKKKKS